MSRVEVKGKRPGWSVESIALGLSNLIADGLTRWSREIGDLGGAKGGLGRRGTGGKEVLLTPLEVRCMWPMIDGTERGRCCLMRSLVSSGQVAKKPLSTALQKVDLAEKPAVA